MAASSCIFSTLERFSDGNKTGLNTWLKKFDRCCVVANKVDGDNGNIKGQLLLLFVDGRARAILEEFEETQGGQPQTYDALIAKLKEHFDDVTTREYGMKLFENRIKKLNESEEEFMLDLVKLYSDANPGHSAAIKLEAVKHKVLQGISPELRRNIFVFCNDPYLPAVTRENILAHCRKAKTHLSVPNKPGEYSETSAEQVLVGCETGATISDNGVLAAINNLSLQFQDHLKNTEMKLNTFENTISSMNYRGNNYRTRGRSNRSNYFSTRYRGRSSRGNKNGGYSYRDGRGGSREQHSNISNQIKCYRCNGFNHYAKDCLLYKDRASSENY